MNASHWPPEFVSRIQQQFPEASSAFLAALDETPATSLRLNPNKFTSSLPYSQVPWHPDGYFLPERPLFTMDPWFHAGMYYVQEASSMFLAYALGQVIDFQSSLRVLDLCAAPGGKSTLVASLLSEDSLLVANEVIRSRAQILSENLQKWGTIQAVVSQNDPEDFQALPGFFDLVLVDAPCSGEGLFRRDHKAADEWSPAHVHLCCERQRRILMDVWDTLKPGGILAYSTCTFNEDENEHNLDWLLQQVDAAPIPVEVPTTWGITVSDYKALPGYRFHPHKVKGEGLFLTLIQKGAIGTDFTFRKKKKKQFLQPLHKDLLPKVEHWLKEREKWAYFQGEEQIFAIPSSQAAAIEVLTQKLYLHHIGVNIGEIKKQKINPSHGMLLSPYFEREIFPSEELSHLDALKFLKKEPVKTALPKGWGYTTFGGVPLGWLKELGNRANNYYPQHWRIRMNIPDTSTLFTIRRVEERL
ncbi:MAG: rRNA methyltransferase [Bacteroidota bacterium]